MSRPPTGPVGQQYLGPFGSTNVPRQVSFDFDATRERVLVGDTKNDVVSIFALSCDGFD